MTLESKSSRILDLYQMFITGKVVNKQDVATKFGVNTRSIQRDIEAIRAFLSEKTAQQGVVQTIEYDAKEKGYKLVSQEVSHLSEGEMLAVCKILIESRAFTKDEVSSLLNRILNLSVSPKEKAQIEWYIANEIYNYANPAHASVNTEYLWMIAQAVKEQRVLEISYGRVKGQETVCRKVQPVGILFSEYYFYLMGVIPDKKDDFDKKNDPYPTIYRIDRIKEIKETDEKFQVAYKDRFQEGEYKNRVQYMYGGEIQHIEFNFYGSSIEAVLDRLPMSEIVESSEEVFKVKAETFGKGILMWLLSQGSKVEVLGPTELKEQWLKEVNTIVEREASQS